MKNKNKKNKAFKYPGKRVAVDGSSAVIMCERESSDAASAYPITPATQMGDDWAETAANGHRNISGRPLIFIEPESGHAAAAVTAGLSMTGLRASSFSSGQGIAYMHESLYAAVGKRLTWVLNIGARAMTRANLSMHAGHDDYHCMDDTGFFQLFARDAQTVADLNVVAHRIAELALTPGAIAQDGFLTTHLIESVLVPERALIEEYLGRPDDMIVTPTAAQQMIYGETRRRIPELWDVDNSVMVGLVQNQDSYMQSVAAQRPFFFDHIPELATRAFEEFHNLTGRRYDRVMGYRAEDADYLIIGQGSMIPMAEAVADHLRAQRGIKAGVVDLVMFRPFPADLLSHTLKGRKGVAVVERLDQPLAVDLPLMREIRATISRCLENGRDVRQPPFPELATYQAKDAPALYSGSFGMGSRDLQPEAIIGVVENMLPDGAHKKFFYLSIDFLRDNPASPKQRIHQETIETAYPHVRDLTIRGSENPNLLPADSITVRFHSLSGWGAMAAGRNLAMVLFDLTGYHIKAYPKFGAAKKGEPTTYYLAAAPKPIRINCEYTDIDVVLSPDPNVFKHTNALAGLREGGVFVIQSELASSEAVWSSIPAAFRRIIVDRNIRLFYLDAFKIAREVASDPHLQLRMQGIAFLGAFFAASPVIQQHGLSEEQLIGAVENQLQNKFGVKGKRVVDENLTAVKRGYDEIKPVAFGSLDETPGNGKTRLREPALPVMLKHHPQSQAPISDIHRFWEQTGSFYARGMGTDCITDPFIGLGVMPAGTAILRDLTGIRSRHPQWIAENCTACGDCYTVCPDTAIPGLVNEVGQILDTVVKRIVKQGKSVKHLRRAVRQMEPHLRGMLNEASEVDHAGKILDQAIDKTLQNSALDESAQVELKQEFEWFREELNGFQFALSRPHYSLPEQDSPGEGGLLSITVDPNTCKGCMECVAVCEDDALRPVMQTAESIDKLRRDWDFWLDLPNTPKKYIRVDDIEEGIGALQTILLDKNHYRAFSGGDCACPGCGEKSVVHLFVATVEALMQPRIKRHVTYLTELIGNLEKHIRLRLVNEIDVGDASTIADLIQKTGSSDITLATIAQHVERIEGGEPIDQEWLHCVTRLLAQLKQLKWKYEHGTTGRGRARMGMLNATGCSSVWGSTFPFNPYPFPWAHHLVQDTASLAMGVFEGHMAKMAEGFKAVRLAELELTDDYQPAEHDEFFACFNWQQFTDEEWELCPPVVAMGGDGAMNDIGFQNLSRALMSGKPIKVLILDTQVYSSTGGQASTSGFTGQISDTTPFGNCGKGKHEFRKEIGLIGMAHRTSFILQSTIAQPNHMIEGFIRGLKVRRPALFNVFTPCQPEHGIGDDMSEQQSRLAVESRAWPLFRYDPDIGELPEDCLDLEGNPSPDEDWPVYTLRYLEDGREQTMDLPMTFADFAITEIRFRKHFRVAPPDTWNERMVPLSDFLELPEYERESQFPYVWSIDRRQQLTRLLVAQPIVASCEERQDFWNTLRAMARVGEKKPTHADIQSEVRQEFTERITENLLQMVQGGDAASLTQAFSAIVSEPATGNQNAVSPESSGGAARR